MITIKRNGARHPLAKASRASIGYGFNIAINDGQPGATIGADDQHGKRIHVYFTSDELDRLCEARDSYMRETAHRGYPVKG